jgi:DNA helicase-2/ATP-dependent DNA helicase PcrA
MQNKTTKIEICRPSKRNLEGYKPYLFSTQKNAGLFRAFLKTISGDARFIRILNRGTDLREHLAERWRAEGAYIGAREIVAGALLQEHFSSSTRVWRGVNIMTIHKSKGKEFDEVVIFEGARTGRLLRENATIHETEQARLMLRVAVTRARQRTTVLTPKWTSCPLL